MTDLHLIAEYLDLLLVLSNALPSDRNKADKLVALILDKLVQLLKVIESSDDLFSGALKVLHNHLLKSHVVLGQLDLALRVRCDSSNAVALCFDVANDNQPLCLFLLEDANLVLKGLNLFVAGFEQLVLNIALQQHGQALVTSCRHISSQNTMPFQEMISLESNMAAETAQ